MAHVVACANGTDALILALQASGISQGSRVGLPNLTFWATYEAVIHAGFTPVLIDISSTDFQLDFAAACAALEQRHVDALLLVHLYGWASSDLGRFRDLARAHGVALIEDGAQGFGVELCAQGEPRSLFADADIATLSFYPAKVFGGCMDGGAVVTRRAEIRDRLRSLRDHGRDGHYSHAAAGWNSRMGGLQAVYLLEMLGIMPELIRERRELMQRYADALADLAPRAPVILPPEGQRGNGYLNVIRLGSGIADQVHAALAARGVQAARIYPLPVSGQTPAREALTAGHLSRSKDLCTRVLSLPLFPGLRDEEFDTICAKFREVLDVC